MDRRKEEHPLGVFFFYALSDASDKPMIKTLLRL